MNRHTLRIAIVLAALLAGASVWMSRTPQDGAASEVPSAESTAAVRAPKANTAPPPRSEPSASGPLQETVARLDALQRGGPAPGFQAKRDALERAATAGDTGAAGELGNLMLSCDGYLDLGDDDIEALLVEGVAMFGSDVMELPDSVPLDAAADAAKHAFGRLRDICSGASGFELTADDRRRALDLLRRAARAGNTGAMSNFGLFAFADFADRRALIGDPQGVRERKREARQFLERAIAAGNVDALWTAATAHEEGSFVERSDVLAYAHFHAYRQASLASGGDARVLDAELAFFAASLTPEQVADARRRGDAIYAACCRRPDNGS